MSVCREPPKCLCSFDSTKQRYRQKKHHGLMFSRVPLQRLVSREAKSTAVILEASPNPYFDTRDPSVLSGFGSAVFRNLNPGSCISTQRPSRRFGFESTPLVWNPQPLVSFLLKQDLGDSWCMVQSPTRKVHHICRKGDLLWMDEILQHLSPGMMIPHIPAHNGFSWFPRGAADLVHRPTFSN